MGGPIVTDFVNALPFGYPAIFVVMINLMYQFDWV